MCRDNNTQLSWLLVALEYGVGDDAAKAKAVDASSLRLGLEDKYPAKM